MNIGRKIADARRAKNLTQEQLAELMNVTRQTVSRWESQAAYPEMEKIVNLSQILEVSCDYLLNDKMERPEQANLSGKERTQAPAVTRLLQQVKGKPVRIQLFSDAMDYDINDKKSVILDFDGGWAHLGYKSGKKTGTKLLPVSAIASIKLEKEEETWNTSVFSDLFSR